MEALKFAQANTVDVVITDINMPNIDGVTFIRELKNAALCHHLVCVLTTESELGKHGMKMQTLKEAWITKPVTPAQVLNIVGELRSD